MSKFSIIPKGGGAARYSGTPTYTGTYMKTGVLEFREIASPTPIPFSVGDYVVYSRTGRTYRLYELPQVKKQAANSKYGGGYLYQNVQFKDDSYQLEICPFRDLVVGDNRVHFSTQPAISVWDDVAGIAERIQACLDDMYGSGAWVIRLATTSEGLDPDLATLMTDERDFSVSGVSCLGVLAKIYEVWPNIGWVYKVESGVNTIVIGGAGLNVAQSSSYGKGNGLLSITRNVANADQLANRLYVYGSSRNMLSKWYSQFAIKDAQSVDIQNLMLPIERPSDVPAAQYGGWGESDDGGVMKPDPAKAFVEDATLAAANLRPKTVYFDGSEDLKEIYPTISGMTIADVIQAKSDYGDTDYVPDTSIYTDTSVRVDRVLAVLSTFDSGLAAAAGKSAYTLNYGTYAQSGQSVSVPAGQTLTRQIFRDEFSVSPGRSDFLAEYPAFGLIGGGQAAYLDFTLERKHSGSYEQFYTQRVQLINGDAGSRSVGAGSVKCDNNEMVFTSGDKVRITMSLVLDNTSGTSAASGLLSNASGTLTYGAKVHRDKTFQIRLRQLGFNIQEQAALGEGKAIAFTSGRCAGRSFNIQACVYESDTDTWLLDVWRSEDESLAQYFPNTDYPIAAGDEFVLLEIAMPAIYVHVAEHRLLDAALELLADTKVEQWQYTPEIDAKFMVENSRTINAGEVIGLTDADVVVDAGPFLVDSVSINEGDAEIPTYKVTLRERKKKSYTDTGGAVSSNSRSVGGSTDDDELANVYSLLHFKADKSALVDLLKKDDYHFESDPDFDDEVKLKAAYDGLRIPGLRFGIGRTDFDLEVRNIAGEGETPVWVLYSPLPLITGGDQIVHSGTPGGGGGGGAAYLHELLDVIPQLSPSDGYLLAWDEDAVNQAGTTGAWKAISQSSITPDLSNYYTKSETYSKTQVDDLLSPINATCDSLQAQIDAVSSRDMFDELTASVLFADIITATDIYGYLHGTVDEAVKLSTSGPLSIWGVQYWNNGIPSDVTGQPNLYIGSTQVQTAGNTQPLAGISTITLVAQSTRSTSGNVIEVVTESDGQGGTITYLHTTLPIISDGDQIVGDGTPGSGSGGGSTYLHELLDVVANLAPSDGYLLAWDANAQSQAGPTGAWKAISQSSVLAPVTALIPAQASASNQLADKDFVNSSIATATATYRGSYNLVSDLGLTTAATESQIGTALASAVSDEDNNDYAFVQIPTSDATPTEIARTDRYKYNGSAWVFEYSLNNSGYTAAQWAAINSGITTAKRQGYDAIAGYFDANGKLTPAHVGDLSATYALVSHTHTIAQVTNLQDELDALSARIDSVASRDDFDELTATVFYSDIVAATDIYGALHGDADNALNLEGHAANYFGTASAVTALENNFDSSGNAKTALKLTTSGPLNIWGVQYWNSGVPSAVTGRPSFGAGADVPAGQTFKIGDATFSWVAGSNGNPGYLYVDTAFMSAGDQIIGSGTPGQGGGGGGKNYLYELLDTAYAWDAAFPTGISEQQVLIFTPGADSKNGTGTGAWSYVPKTAVGAFYTAGTGLALSNANVFSLDVNAAKTALGLGDAAYLGVASAIGASVSGLVSGALLYGVLGDSFDSTNTVKAFVNSSIATATATFRGTNTTATTEAAFLTWANALTHDLNDYVFWQTTDSYGNTIYKRYKFDGTNWVFEYNLNNSSFTTAQWDAINSGITSTKRSDYDTIVGYFTNGQLQAAHVGDLSGTYLPKSGGSMNNTTVVTNLNADLLDGKHANEFAAATHSHTISQVTNLESNLDTLSGRIDAIGSRNMFDELSASVFFSDIVTASTAYIESIVGSLTGTASNASKLEDHAASYFATASSLNSYLLLSGGTMTGVLTLKGNQYQDAYDGALNMNNSDIYGLNSIYTADVSDNQAEGIHFYRDSTHVDSFRMASGSLLFTPNRPLGGTATEYTVYHSCNSNKADVGWRCDNLVATCVELIPPSGASNGGYIDFHHGGSSADYTTRLIEWTSGKLTCEGNFHVNGTFTSSGDQTISSDEALKMNLEDIRLSAKDIAGVRAVTFDWKDGRGRSFGTIAQDWLGILPEAVSGEEGNYSVAYAQAAMVAAVVNSREIVEIEKRETEQDKEIRKLKAKVKKLEAEVKRLRMN